MSKRILVVEDQEDNRQIIRDLPAATDYVIAEAVNGEEALSSDMFCSAFPDRRASRRKWGSPRLDARELYYF